jgi:hypothetical protein
MKMYDAVKLMLKSQTDSAIATKVLRHEGCNPDDPELKAEVNDMLIHDSLAMALAVLVRMDFIDDARNDQCQASARELVKLIAKRLNVDLEYKFGIKL